MDGKDGLHKEKEKKRKKERPIDMDGPIGSPIP